MNILSLRISWKNLFATSLDKLILFLRSISCDKRHAEFNSNEICRCGKRLILIQFHYEFIDILL